MPPKTFLEIAEFTEDEARSYLEQIRWPDGPTCVHCGSTNVSKLQGRSTRPGVYKCREKGCRKQFTVTVGTIFHRSHIPLKKWALAFHLMCASKKGISALQLQRQLGLKSYQSAWHMAHRIRHAMRQQPLARLLTGEIEVDETWVGGKPRFRPGKETARRGPRSLLDPTAKTPVVALIQREGEARVMPIEHVNGDTLREAIDKHVDKTRSRLLTDEHRAYRPIGREFAYGHDHVNHSRHEYLRDGVSVNAAESFFALLKRGIHGTFHHVSKHHLERYCDEFSFRWNHRKVTDEQRTEAALRRADGCRLPYKATSAQRIP